MGNLGENRKCKRDVLGLRLGFQIAKDDLRIMHHQTDGALRQTAYLYALSICLPKSAPKPGRYLLFSWRHSGNPFATEVPSTLMPA